MRSIPVRFTPGKGPWWKEPRSYVATNQKSQEKAKEAQINHLYRHIGQLSRWNAIFCRKGPVYESQHTASHDRLRDHQQLSLVRQCILLDVNRASMYYRSVPTRAEDLELMALMDRQYLKTPFYG